MDQQTIAIFIGGLIVTHFATILGAIGWAVRHIVNYLIFKKEFELLSIEVEKLKKDVTKAHEKIRTINSK